jgi:hypothetical protein
MCRDHKDYGSTEPKTRYVTMKRGTAKVNPRCKITPAALKIEGLSCKLTPTGGAIRPATDRVHFPDVVHLVLQDLECGQQIDVIHVTRINMSLCLKTRPTHGPSFCLLYLGPQTGFDSKFGCEVLNDDYGSNH